MSCLLVVDFQNDFCQGGPLAIKGTGVGQKITYEVNRALSFKFIQTFGNASEEEDFDMIAFTLDWHPPNHVSFASTHGKQPFEEIDVPYGKQIMWPDHCVQNTEGSKLHKGIGIPRDAHFVYKGTKIDVDSYSAFFDANREDTGLDKLLKDNDIRTVYICGLALDVCVKYTAIDCASLGYSTYVLKRACGAVYPENNEQTLNELEKHGVVCIESMSNRIV
ncbi:hypothetical protein GEMRC1_011834 [Eukaryota sp. GEM-RC1]